MAGIAAEDSCRVDGAVPPAAGVASPDPLAALAARQAHSLARWQRGLAGTCALLALSLFLPTALAALTEAYRQSLGLPEHGCGYPELTAQCFALAAWWRQPLPGSLAVLLASGLLCYCLALLTPWSTSLWQPRRRRVMQLWAWRHYALRMANQLTATAPTGQPPPALMLALLVRQPHPAPAAWAGLGRIIEEDIARCFHPYQAARALLLYGLLVCNTFLVAYFFLGFLIAHFKIIDCF